MPDCFDLKPGMVLGAALESGACPLDAARKNTILAFSRSGLQTCRLNLRWDLIEPENGNFCQEALDNVKNDALYFLGLGIRPLVCLCSGHEPEWFLRQGGWAKKDQSVCYLLYAEKVTKSIGHLVSDYLTFGGMNQVLTEERIRDSSGHKMHRSAVYLSLSNVAYCHCRCYRMIHDTRREMGFKNSHVSFSNLFTGSELHPQHKPTQAASDFLSEMDITWILTRAMALGEFRFPLSRVGSVRKRIYADFLAIDYREKERAGILRNFTRAHSSNPEVSDSLTLIGRRLTRLIKLRVYITGMEFRSSDELDRCSLIYQHLKEICNSDVPVRRIYFGSFLDEANGSSGLAGADGEKTALRKSGEFLGKIAIGSRITQELYDEYVKGASYTATDLKNTD